MLKTLRLSAGVGLRELSRRIDVSPTYLSLVENGKQPPPNATRIAQIEQALEAPTGCLDSLTCGLGADMARYVEEMPEAIDLLEVSRRNAMTAADFMELTSFLNAYGWESMRRMLHSAGAKKKERGHELSDRTVSGPCVWGYLQEELIFDMYGVDGKADFLDKLLGLVAERTGAFSKEVAFAELIERERYSSTGIGTGVAVPHLYLPGVERMIVALARIPDGMDFDSVDGEPVRIALLLLGPRSTENLHLRLLARFAKLLSYTSFHKRLLEADKADEIISIFSEAELGIP
jgi:mannitol/fructose-specific phosphotransferase system IIA component (Ntr-type)/transcriptional regulator with XRE-family HTH domain